MLDCGPKGIQYSWLIFPIRFLPSKEYIHELAHGSTLSQRPSILIALVAKALIAVTYLCQVMAISLAFFPRSLFIPNMARSVVSHLLLVGPECMLGNL